nr:hypothetical protein [Tanacetum cinerariifolium]
MLDSEDSTVTYTEVSSLFEDFLDIGSLGVVVYRYDGLPMHPPSLDYVPRLEHPPSPNYVPGAEHPPPPVYVPYVLEPTYLEFMPPEDDVLPGEEQPLPATVSPTVDSLDTLLSSILRRRMMRILKRIQLTIPLIKMMRKGRRSPLGTMLMMRGDEDEEKEEHPTLADSILPPLVHQDVLEVTLPPRKRLCIALRNRFEVGECSFAPTVRPTRGFRADYGLVGTLDVEISCNPDREIGYEITHVWEDPDEIAE